jgi:cell division protein FtsB
VQARIAQLKTDFIKLKTHMEAERLIQKRALEQCDEYKIMVRFYTFFHSTNIFFSSRLVFFSCFVILSSSHVSFFSLTLKLPKIYQLREKESKLLTLQHALDRHRVQDEQFKQQQVEIDGLKSTNQQLEQHITSLIASAKYLDDDEQTRLKAVVAEYAKSLDSLNDNLRERDQKIGLSSC